jgi:hypothetical protein
MEPSVGIIAFLNLSNLPGKYELKAFAMLCGFVINTPSDSTKEVDMFEFLPIMA